MLLLLRREESGSIKSSRSGEGDRTLVSVTDTTQDSVAVVEGARGPAFSRSSLTRYVHLLPSPSSSSFPPLPSRSYLFLSSQPSSGPEHSTLSDACSALTLSKHPTHSSTSRPRSSARPLFPVAPKSTPNPPQQLLNPNQHTDTLSLVHLSRCCALGICKRREERDRAGGKEAHSSSSLPLRLKVSTKQSSSCTLIEAEATRDRSRPT